MALAFGTVSYTISAVSPVITTVNTTASSGVIYAYLVYNGAIGATGSISGGGLTWTQRAFTDIGGFYKYSREFTAPFSSQVVSQTMTYSDSSDAQVTFAAIVYVEISGAATSSFFDPNLSSAVSSNGSDNASPPADPLSITTTNANDAIIVGYRFYSTAAPTSGLIGGVSATPLFSGISNSYVMVEGLIVSSTQSAASCTVGTGVGDSNSGIADAIIAAPASGAPTPVRPLLFGVGGMIGWRLPLLGSAALGAAKLIKSNPPTTRRRLLRLRE